MNKNRMRKLTDRFNEFIGKAEVEIISKEIDTFTIQDLINIIIKRKEATITVNDLSFNYYGIYLSTSIDNTIIIPTQPHDKVNAIDLVGYLTNNVIDCELKYNNTEKFASETHAILIEMQGKLYSINAIKYRLGNYKVLTQEVI